MAHIIHWSTGSYAEHCCLGAFYDNVIEAIDAIVENYQGMYGKIDRFSVNTEPVTNIREYLQNEADWIESNRDAICNDSPSIGALIDDLVSVYTRTIFLLGMK